MIDISNKIMVEEKTEEGYEYDTPSDDIVTNGKDMTESKIESKASPRKWQLIGDGSYKPSPKSILVDRVPSGYYSFEEAPNIGSYITKKSYMKDDFIKLPIVEFDEILADIMGFWELQDKFKEYGFTHKRGILMYGRQGCGKSFLISSIIDDLINNRDGVVFSITNVEELRLFNDLFVNSFRSIEPERPVVIIYEDIDALIGHSKSTESQVLNTLDGINHTNRIVNIATTNHIEKLEERIVNRPSRFDKRYNIKEPNDEVRKVFIENKLKPNDLKDIDIDKWIKSTEGYNLSHIKELIISTILYRNNFDKAIEFINRMKEKPEAEYDWYNNKKKAGFS